MPISQSSLSWTGTPSRFRTTTVAYIVGIIVATLCGRAVAQEVIDLPITVRVDTTKPEINAIYTLWKNYLQSRPDSVYDNAHWNAEEKRRYPDFDFTQGWTYMNPDILRAFPPQVLSIEREGEYYAVRTLYYSPTAEGEYRASNPWALQRVYARQDPEGWRLYNALQISTNHWKRDTIGVLVYASPPEHRFDTVLAQQSAQFCDSVVTAFGLNPPGRIEFYITHNQDELARILGLDFALGATMGRAYSRNRQVFTSLGSEWYPHELAHVLFREFVGTHFLLIEGIATLTGGSENRSFTDLASELDDFLRRNDSLTFSGMIEQVYREGSMRLYYTTGAVLCRMALDHGGAEAVKQLMKSSSYASESLFESIERVLELREPQLTEVWRAKCSEYARE